MDSFVVHNGVSAGSTYINGSASDGYCVQYMPTQSVTVQQPTYFVTSSASQTAEPAACGGAPGFFINLSNDVADQNGNQIYTAGIGPEESLDGGPLISGYSNPTTTTSTGTFHDTPFGACFPGASGQYCADGHTDTHAATVGSTAYSISTVYNSRQCTEGESVTITGNLPAQNGTITEGTVN